MHTGGAEINDDLVARLARGAAEISHEQRWLAPRLPAASPEVLAGGWPGEGFEGAVGLDASGVPEGSRGRGPQR
ncbi:hypothetical protein [Amycolatopsis rubida]|uniref:Uncharacterized protein n=1 Tax=Amycolatopsis rubida TaxID=112413 RepID=A0A1I6B7J4_9PSEU|nr:hypothetical protein [Amycolatopsis rubida]SFQ76895.1 hypothetical protein SAMN05421854_12410 [Amycolatopsis rubida]